MIKLGAYNTLQIIRKNNKGIILDGKEAGELFIPLKEIAGKNEITTELEVFIYTDSNNKPVATTKKPRAVVGQFAYLRVISTSDVGAFLDWGLKKDLFVPFSEQMRPMQKGSSHVVYIYLDEKSKRVVASSKLTKFMKYTKMDPDEYTPGQPVEIIIINETDLGYKAIINKIHWGILYKNEIFKQLRIGQELPAFIKKIRDDGKIDLSLYKKGAEQKSELAKKILADIKSKGGFLPVNDKSSPNIIYQLFGESKSTFKKAIGELYKQRLITIEQHGIRLNKDSDN